MYRIISYCIISSCQAPMMLEVEDWNQQTYQLPPVPLPGLCFPLGVHVLEGCGEETQECFEQLKQNLLNVKNLWVLMQIFEEDKKTEEFPDFACWGRWADCGSGSCRTRCGEPSSAPCTDRSQTASRGPGDTDSSHTFKRPHQVCVCADAGRGQQSA